MSQVLDQISFEYWHNNSKKVASKSYYVDHNGYRYGDGREDGHDDELIVFVRVDEKGNETVYGGETTKESYLRFVEALCNLSPQSFSNYKNSKAEKNRIYSEQQVQEMTNSKLKSTRVKSGKQLSIDNSIWYAACNLKISEYIHAADINIADEERVNWCIRLIDIGSSYTEQEREIVNSKVEESRPDEFTVNVEYANIQSNKQQNNFQKKIRHTDFLEINRKNMELGDLGEMIVMHYEITKLTNAGRSDLAKKVEQISKIDDGAGYDIHSFTEDGKELYIEVKTTEKNTPGRFYLSENERKKSEEFGSDWCVYRLFCLTGNNNVASMVIYEGPISERCYKMQPSSWLVVEKYMQP